MTAFSTMDVPAPRTGPAPDGSDVRVLLELGGGGMAQFELGPGAISKPVRHRTVEEIWYILAGQGRMWRSQDGRTEIVDLRAGTCLTIPLGTTFQFRSYGHVPLTAVGVTMPPWPGEGEADTEVDGCPEWEAELAAPRA
jgi:mannose-6-phosphate isomerase-like protein (cupin superfamily)